MPECAYCGSLDADTDDHIPPRNIYTAPGPPRPPNVKSCFACNNSASTDDEYFRDIVVKYHRVADLPQVQQQIAAMLRTAKLPAKQRYAQAVLKSFMDVEVKTEAGLYLGRQPAFTVDAERLRRILRRFVFGLYRWETGVRLAADTTLTIVPNPDSVNQLKSELEGVMSGAQVTTVQEGVFWYAWQRAQDNPMAMVWLLVFFDVMPFVAVAADRERFQNTAA
jgi:hypothetical protein